MIPVIAAAITFHFASPAAVKKFCYGKDACAVVWSSDQCDIVMPRRGSIPEAQWRALRAHEIAHCRGWKH